MSKHIALTVLGGFLGSGKTTLLNHLLRTHSGERVLVMVNDFGAINIDAKLIAREQPEHDGVAGGILELTNGCACCSVGGDLMQAFLNVLALPNPPDRIVIEASGVGDPSKIAQIGHGGVGFSSEGIITMVDAEAVRHHAADRYVGDIVHAQLRAADLLLVNKTDLIDALDLKNLQNWLGAHAPNAKMLTCVHGQVDPALVFGVALQPHQKMSSHRNFDNGKFHLGHSAHSSEQFVSSHFESHRRFSRPALEHALNALPPQVIRAKGIVWLFNENTPWLVQFCGKRWRLEQLAEQGAAVDEISQLVFISARTEHTFDPLCVLTHALVNDDRNSASSQQQHLLGKHDA
ncbi:CobW family GTP-binding protein [Allopusillimonas ginsengisoli]|uniref:CobW family GTP-binding protein n=1 Tax=Allopusillimonas ginsengisoli TaxID=453575 RepID=UPI00102216AC|nr:GTP-binding protein [Allopusillimonas ginsengisoli]TEA77224.1 GTP-binding protein [Allopusillimonas ginsengisoli]